ncbi:GNAT family N-acetyltransferase [Thermodesulfobacteriota bacterium]
MHKKPVTQVIASRMVGFFGVRFFNLLYGQKDLLSHTESNSLTDYTHVRLANREDLDKIVALMGKEIKKRFERNLALESVCYVAECEGAIAGYLWTNRDVMSLLGMCLRELSENKIFLHDVFVFPEQRRKKIFHDLLHFIYNDMKNEGFHIVSCLVGKDNGPSITGFKKIGVKFGKAPVLKLPGIRPFVLGRLPKC